MSELGFLGFLGWTGKLLSVVKSDRTGKPQSHTPPTPLLIGGTRDPTPALPESGREKKDVIFRRYFFPHRFLLSGVGTDRTEYYLNLLIRMSNYIYY
ncbi:MAG: hypothetical protein V1779_16875 [bacterium]